MCIDAALKQQSDQLTFVMDLRQITKHFAVNLQVAIDSASQGMYHVQYCILYYSDTISSILWLEPECDLHEDL